VVVAVAVVVIVIVVITPLNRVLLEKLIITQQGKRFSVCDGTRVCNSLQLFPALSQINRDHTLTP